MKKNYFTGTALVVLMLLVAACSPVAVPTASAPTKMPTALPAGPSVMVGKSDQLGSFLVDEKNMTLYLFTKDTPNTSNCYDKCATAWPPLLTTGVAVAKDGVEAAKLGTTKRTDGTMQVTYNGWPLYYYVKDTKPGDVVGQNVGDVWFVISPAGEQVMTAAVLPTGPSIMVGKSDQLRSFLVDEKNMTLYLYTKDTPNTSNCYDKCATAWPPLLTTGAAVGKDDVDASKLGTTKRTDGSMQVTYNGWPLYYYVKDTKPGDVVGQNVGEVWFVISPTGEMVKPAAVLPTGPSIMVGKNDTLGSFLVDDKNMTLYLFTKDTPNISNCYDKCATAWPPLLTTGAAVAGDGVDASKLGTTKRTDGTMQVTYNGWPLYYYVKDTKPGDVIGQNVGDVWFVITPVGDQGKSGY